MQITLNRGNTLKFPVHLLIGGVYQSMVGGLLYLTVKNNFEDPDANAVYQGSWAGTGTETFVNVPNTTTETWLENTEQSKNYYADVKFITSGGEAYSGEVDILVVYRITGNQTGGTPP